MVRGVDAIWHRYESGHSINCERKNQIRRSCLGLPRWSQWKDRKKRR